jgi:hypothetical protein
MPPPAGLDSLSNADLKSLVLKLLEEISELRRTIAAQRDEAARLIRWAGPAEHQTKRYGQGDGAEAVVEHWKRAAADGRQEIEAFDPRGADRQGHGPAEGLTL